MQVVVIRILIVVALSCLSWSCSLFRKSEQTYNHTAVRDSSRVITDRVDLSKVIVFNGRGSVLELTAEGFKVIRVDSNGTVQAEGLDGKLNVKRNDFNLGSVEMADSGAVKVDSFAARDSVHNEGAKQSEGKASPDPWFNWWWVTVIGVVILVVVFLFFKKVNISSWLK